MAAPNQKKITVRKQKCDKHNLYAAINLAAMDEAAKNLDAGAFKMWIFLAKNQNGFNLELSSNVAEEQFGLKDKQYRAAVKTLKQKGYLMLKKGKTVFDFYEVPQIDGGFKTDKTGVLKSADIFQTGQNGEVKEPITGDLPPSKTPKRDEEIIHIYNTNNNTIDEQNSASANASAQFCSYSSDKSDEINIKIKKIERKYEMVLLSTAQAYQFSETPEEKEMMLQQHRKFEAMMNQEIEDIRNQYNERKCGNGF